MKLTKRTMIRAIAQALIYFNITIIFSSCGSSGNNDNSNKTDNNKNSGYYVTKYQTGSSIYLHEYNDIGQRIKLAEPDGDIFTYKYNAKNQLISKRKTNKSGNVYNYFYTYNNANQMIKETRGSGTIYNFTYDNNGNLKTMHNQTTNKNARTYFYNSLNQRIKGIYSDGTVITISYNTMGQVIKAGKTNNKGETSHNTYTYNSDGKIIQGLESDGDIRTYTYKDKSCINRGSFLTAKPFLSALCKK